MTDSNKKAEFGWAMFDWANSSYSLVISTAIFPTFFIAMTDLKINLWGMEISNSSLYAFTVSLAYFIVCLISPILSGIADFGGSRKKYMRLFTTIGSLSCMLLFFFKGMDRLYIGILGFLFATLCHAGSLVFYDAYLADLVPPERSDKLSAKGYAYGYIGSVILLIFNILVIQKPESFGFSEQNILEHIPIRLAFFSVGCWWLGFSQISFANLPKDQSIVNSKSSILHGINELKKAWKRIQNNNSVKYYLMSFFCYSAGVQTVVYLASPFAQKELKFASADLIMVILLLQIVAIGGAYLFAWVSKRMGNIISMKIMLVLWVFICILAYLVQTQLQFYFIAGMVGMVIGGIQSLSRSSFSKIIPKDKKDLTCFFSFYDVVFYLSVICGTFIFGLVEQLTGDMRNSVISLIIFFVLGFIFIHKVKSPLLEKKQG
ncbi:MAG: MFS transporter [Saprospiraceae bacterium]